MPRYLKFLLFLWIAVIVFSGYKVWAQFGFINFGLIHTTTNPSTTVGQVYIFDGIQDIQWGNVNQSTHTFTFNNIAIATNPASITVNSSPAGAQASIYFQDAGVSKWQIGKQTDNSWFMYDAINGLTFFAVNTGGNITIGESAVRTITLVGLVTFNNIPTFNTHIAMAAAVGTVSSCGTSPVFRGTDNAFQITVGTSAGTACTYTFGSAYTANPFCTFTSNDPAVPIGIQTLSTTAITVFSTANMTSKAIFGVCLGS